MLKGFIRIILIPLYLIGSIGNHLYRGLEEADKNGYKSIKIIFQKICATFNKFLEDIKNFIRGLYIPISWLSSKGEIAYKTLNNPEKKEKMLKKHMEEQIDDIKKDIFMSKNEIFTNSIVSKFILFITFALQFISIFTTFNGTRTYFEKVHWLAPVLFALTIQISLLLFSNIAWSKRRRLLGRKILLIVMALISIFFSYIGVINSALPPSQDYRNYIDDFNDVYEDTLELVSAMPNASTFKEEVDSITHRVNVRLTDIDSAIESKNESIQVLTVPEYVTSSTTTSDGEVIYNRTRNPTYDLNMEKINSFREDIKNLQKNQEQISEYKDQKLEDLSSFSPNDSQKIEEEYKLFAENYNESSVLLEKSNDTLPTNLKGLYFLTETVSTSSDSSKLIKYDDIEKSVRDDLGNYDSNKNGFAKSIYTFLSGNSFSVDTTSSPESTQSTNELSQTIDTTSSVYYHYLYNKVLNYTQSRLMWLDNISSQLNKTYENDSEITKKLLDELESKKQELQKFNINENSAETIVSIVSPDTIAFQRFVKTESLDKAIFSLFLAVLVDGLTVFIPWLGEKHRESVLYAKNNKDLLNDQEDVLEDMLVSLWVETQRNSNNEHGNSYEIDILDHYLKEFELSPYTSDIGYLLKIEQTTAEQTKYRELTAQLVGMGYLKYINNDKYIEIMNEYLGIDEEKKKENENNIQCITNNYYLMRGNFLLWTEGNIANMKRYKKLFDESEG